MPRALGALAGAIVLAMGCARVPLRPADPLSAEEHNALGVAYFRRGEYEAAAREFGAALARGPARPRVLANLGDARLALGEVEAAIDAYERARAASPDDPAIANNLAWALLQHERRWPEAEPLIRSALARAPEPRGYYLDTLGLLLLRKDEPREALVVFRAALADTALTDPRTRGLVLGHAADALRRLGEAEAAERCDRLAAGHVERSEAITPEVGAGESVC